jgi:aspartyl-tRNA synthetase
VLRYKTIRMSHSGIKNEPILEPNFVQIHTPILNQTSAFGAHGLGFFTPSPLVNSSFYFSSIYRCRP